jgi:hypothetical protein
MPVLSQVDGTDLVVIGVALAPETDRVFWPEDDVYEPIVKGDGKPLNATVIDVNL